MTPYAMNKLIDKTVARIIKRLDNISKQIKELSNKIDALGKREDKHVLLDTKPTGPSNEVIKEGEVITYKCKGKHLSDYVGYYKTPDNKDCSHDWVCFNCGLIK